MQNAGIYWTSASEHVTNQTKMLNYREFRNPIKIMFGPICKSLLPSVTAIMCFLHLKSNNKNVLQYSYTLVRKLTSTNDFYIRHLMQFFPFFRKGIELWEAVKLSPEPGSVVSQALSDPGVHAGLICHWRMTLFVSIARRNSAGRQHVFLIVDDNERANLSKINWPKWHFVRQNLFHVMIFVHKGPVFQLFIILLAF